MTEITKLRGFNMEPLLRKMRWRTDRLLVKVDEVPKSVHVAQGAKHPHPQIGDDPDPAQRRGKTSPRSQWPEPLPATETPYEPVRSPARAPPRPQLHPTTLKRVRENANAGLEQPRALSVKEALDIANLTREMEGASDAAAVRISRAILEIKLR